MLFKNRHTKVGSDKHNYLEDYEKCPKESDHFFAWVVSIYTGLAKWKLKYLSSEPLLFY